MSILFTALHCLLRYWRTICSDHIPTANAGHRHVWRWLFEPKFSCFREFFGKKFKVQICKCSLQGMKKPLEYVLLRTLEEEFSLPADFISTLLKRCQDVIVIVTLTYYLSQISWSVVVTFWKLKTSENRTL